MALLAAYGAQSQTWLSSYYQVIETAKGSYETRSNRDAVITVTDSTIRVQFLIKPSAEVVPVILQLGNHYNDSYPYLNHNLLETCQVAGAWEVVNTTGCESYVAIYETSNNGLKQMEITVVGPSHTVTYVFTQTILNSPKIRHRYEQED